VVAVDLRGRRDEHALAEPRAVVQHDLGSFEIRDDGVHRLLDDQPRADRGREVEHRVDLVDELVHHRAMQDAVDDEMERGVVAQVLDVLERAGGEIVQDPHLLAVVEEELAEVRADEARTARDEDFPAHGRASLARSPSARAARS
jgi:hypothetical protein